MENVAESSGRFEALTTLLAGGTLVGVLIAFSVYLDSARQISGKASAAPATVEQAVVSLQPSPDRKASRPIIDDSNFKSEAARNEVADVFATVVELSHAEGRNLYGKASISPDDGHLIVEVRPRFVAMPADELAQAMRWAYEPWARAKFVKRYRWASKVEFHGPGGWRRIWPE